MLKVINTTIQKATQAIRRTKMKRTLPVVRIGNNVIAAPLMLLSTFPRKIEQHFGLTQINNIVFAVILRGTDRQKHNIKLTDGIGANIATTCIGRAIVIK